MPEGASFQTQHLQGLTTVRIQSGQGGACERDGRKVRLRKGEKEDRKGDRQDETVRPGDRGAVAEEEEEETHTVSLLGTREGEK